MRLPWKTKSKLLQEEIEYLRAQVVQLQNYVLVVGPQQVAAPAPTPSIVPIPEAVAIEMKRNNLEADIDWELSEGLIDEREWEQKMNDIAALNEFN